MHQKAAKTPLRVFYHWIDFGCKGCEIVLPIAEPESTKDEKMPEDVEYFYNYKRPMPEPMPIKEEWRKETLNANTPLISQIGGDHYHKRAIQPITFILANNLGFCEGNVVKYITRWKDKGGVEDLRKARHYLDFLIEEAEKASG